MLKKVKLTDKGQLEKERKEKGFALYVNGANADLGKGSHRASPSPRVTSKSRLQSGDIEHDFEFIFDADLNKQTMWLHYRPG